MNESDRYDADYFLRGKESGKSLYSDYRWMPDLTIPMVEAIVAHCGITKGSRVLDFGCARGYVVKALRGLGYDAHGVDISEWAITNADEETKPYLSWAGSGPMVLEGVYDWIIAKDVLEHVYEVKDTIAGLIEAAYNGVFAVVPLGYGLDGYVVPDYDRDVTHIHRLSLGTWAAMFMRPGWSVDARYRIPGVKDNYAGWPTGNGFLTARRVES